jgi:hypothetical protein
MIVYVTELPFERSIPFPFTGWASTSALHGRKSTVGLRERIIGLQKYLLTSPLLLVYTYPQMGRPPKPASERLSRVLRFRVTQAELRQLKQQAKAEGTTVAKLLRERVFGGQSKSTER